MSCVRELVPVSGMYKIGASKSKSEVKNPIK